MYVHAWTCIRLPEGKTHLKLFQFQFLFQDHHLRFTLLCCEVVKELSPFNQDFWKLELFKHITICQWAKDNLRWAHGYFIHFHSARHFHLRKLRLSVVWHLTGNVAPLVSVIKLKCCCLSTVLCIYDRTYQLALTQNHKETDYWLWIYFRITP